MPLSSVSIGLFFVVFVLFSLFFRALALRFRTVVYVPYISEISFSVSFGFGFFQA